MFVVNQTDIEIILRDFGIFSKIKYISELQRSDYERNDPDSKEVRLIVKAEQESGPPLVIRFKNEPDVTMELLESQSRFADEMRRNGIITPYPYQSGGVFVRRYRVKYPGDLVSAAADVYPWGQEYLAGGSAGISGYDVLVTVEQFAENEIKAVDPAIAEKTGALLAKMHNISEEKDLHVQNGVLFDPFSANELFDFEAFRSVEPALGEDEEILFHKIVRKYNAYMDVLAPLKKEPKYAVQGDISNCNLYRDRSGEIGIFDFNRCGDNHLFCDLVMQAVFEARLMDYPDDSNEDIEEKNLTSFLRGYGSVRNFSEEEKSWYPYLYAVIDAFWSSDMKWNEDSLMNAVKNGDRESVRRWLEIIWGRLRNRHEIICTDCAG